MLKKILHIALLAFVTMAFTACGDDDNMPAYPADVCYDFVTVGQMSAQGLDFTLQKSGDSPMITYTSAKVPTDTVFYAGRRMIIQYKRSGEAMPYTSGPIDLYGYRTLDNTAQKLVYAMTEEWFSDDIDVVMLTRTGQYINMQASLYCLRAVKPSVFTLEMEPDQLEEPYPELRIRYIHTEPGDNYFTGYASFDISALWNRPTCMGVNISYITPAGVKSTRFDK